MRRKSVKIIGSTGIVFVLVALVTPVWLGYRTYRQNGLDQDLLTAVKHRDTVQVRRLLAHGASANMTDAPIRRESLWQCIAAEAQLALHRTLKGRRHDDSALSIAVSKNYTEIVSLLLAHGAAGVNDDGSTRDEYDDWKRCPLLSVAAQNGNSTIVAGLIQHGSDVKRADSEGLTPLHHACESSNAEAVDRLLKAGAAAGTLDREGDTPLFTALRQHPQVPRIVLALIKAGAPASSPDSYGYAPIQLTDDPTIMQTLLDRGANPNAHGGHGKHSDATPLMLVAMRERDEPDPSYTEGAVSCLALLIQHGAHVNLVDEYGETALTYAAQYSSPPVIRYLIQHGARNTASFRDDSLSSAAVDGMDDNIQELLDDGADPNVCGTDRITPLMIASGDGNDAAVWEILDAGARINASDRDGNTALDFAISEQNTEVIKLLKKHGGRASGRPVRW